MEEAKLAMIDERIEIFEVLLKAIKESQTDLIEIHSSINEIKRSTGIFSAVGVNQEIADLDATKFDLRSSDEIIEIPTSYFSKIKQKSRDEALKTNPPLPTKAPKCSVFSLRKTKSSAKKRKHELKCKLAEIRQALPNDSEVLASELPKKKQRTRNIPQLKFLVTNLEEYPDAETIQTICFTKSHLQSRLTAKLKIKKPKPNILPKNV